MFFFCLEFFLYKFLLLSLLFENEILFSNYEFIFKLNENFTFCFRADSKDMGLLIEFIFVL